MSPPVAAIETLASAARITAEPYDGRRCRFTLDRPLYDGKWVYFATKDEARASSLAVRLFRINAVEAVLITHDSVTVTRRLDKELPVVGMAVRVFRAMVGGDAAAAWGRLGKEVGRVIRAQVESGEPAVLEPLAIRRPSARELRERVQNVLERDINPVIASHGGGVRIIDVLDNVLYLEMWGGCQGCGLKDLTLKNGVAAVVRDAVPEIGAIYDLTNHAAGTSAYFRSK